MMKKQYFLNAHIIDPKNSIDELGGLIVNENGKIEAVGKKVNKNNIPSREKFIDLSGKHIFPGLVDMRVFVGEPGFEYKEKMFGKDFKTPDELFEAVGKQVRTMPQIIIDDKHIGGYNELVEHFADKGLVNFKGEKINADGK